MKHKIIKEFIGSINGYIIDDENLYDSSIYFINYLEDIFKLLLIVKIFYNILTIVMTHTEML